jgi:hypothetical protein
MALSLRLRRKAGVLKSSSGTDIGVFSFMAASLVGKYDSNMTKLSHQCNTST